MTRFTISLLTGVAVLGFASTTFAADLIVDEPAAMPGVVAASGNWDGAYIGVFGGYGWGTFSDNDEDGYFYTDDYKQDAPGWLLGVDVGYNFSLGGGLVAGVVADAAWSNQSGTSEWPVETTIDWQASLRGKLGVDAGTFMPYLTGGLAVAGATVDDQFYDYTDSQTHIGWTVGAGVDIAVADNMTVNLEYRYSDYGNKDYDVYYSDSSIGLKNSTLTVGLNWKF